MYNEAEFKKYRQLPPVVEAATLKEKVYVQLQDGIFSGGPGDILVRDKYGDKCIHTPEEFARLYEPIEEDGDAVQN